MTDAPKMIRPGEVEIELVGWGRPLKLVPSLTAATNLNRRYQGLGNLIQRIAAYDFEAFVAIIAAGAGVTEKGMRKLPDAVYDTGLINLVVPLTKFCTTLANGGRPAEVDDGAEPEADDPSQE